MQSYYAARAPEYDNVYLKPESGRPTFNDSVIGCHQFLRMLAFWKSHAAPGFGRNSLHRRPQK